MDTFSMLDHRNIEVGLAAIGSLVDRIRRNGPVLDPVAEMTYSVLREALSPQTVRTYADLHTLVCELLAVSAPHLSSRTRLELTGYLVAEANCVYIAA